MLWKQRELDSLVLGWGGARRFPSRAGMSARMETVQHVSGEWGGGDTGVFWEPLGAGVRGQCGQCDGGTELGASEPRGLFPAVETPEVRSPGCCVLERRRFVAAKGFLRDHLQEPRNRLVHINLL